MQCSFYIQQRQMGLGTIVFLNGHCRDETQTSVKQTVPYFSGCSLFLRSIPEIEEKVPYTKIYAHLLQTISLEIF
jgi:hypothetical protein